MDNLFFCGNDAKSGAFYILTTIVELLCGATTAEG